MTEHSSIKQQTFVGRFVLPSALALIVYVILHIVYFESWRIDNKTVQYYVAFISGLMLFFCIGFNSLIVYPVVYFRGGLIHERIIASLIVQIVWIIKELVRVSQFFTFGETMYYIFNSAFLLAIIGSFALMGICEMLCRYKLKKKENLTFKVVTPMPVIAIAAGFIALYVMLIWGIGEHWFYIYVAGYKLLFH